MRYESEILYDLMKRDGLLNPPQNNLPYESELKEKYVNDVVGAHPKRQDYRSEWLNVALESEMSQLKGKIVLDGSQTFYQLSGSSSTTLLLKISDPTISFKQNTGTESWDFSDMICDKMPIAETGKWDASEWEKGYNMVLISSYPTHEYDIHSFVLAIRKSYFKLQTVEQFQAWLTNNPLTIKYKLFEVGHTLENLQQKGTWTINGSDSNQNASYSSPLPTSLLKPSTKYYVKFNKDISTVCKQFYFVQSTDIIIPLTTHSTGAYGIITTPSTLDDKTTPIHIYPKDETALTLEQLTDLYVMIIEYQEGMENWDIPYFEGMQTVDLETEE